jgi:transcriptional regulator with XRE-family HTH domain
MKVSKKIGENLKEARKFKGLTQKELADMLYMTQQQYSRFENGIFELNYDQILKICDILDISPNELFDIKA